MPNTCRIHARSPTIFTKFGASYLGAKRISWCPFVGGRCLGSSADVGFPNSRDNSLQSDSDRREILLNLDSVQISGFWAGPGNYEKRKRAFFLLKKDHFLLRFFWLVGSKNLTRCIFCGARFARLLMIFLLQTLRPAALLHQIGAMPGAEKGIYMNAFVHLHVEGGSISNSSCDSSLSESDWPESNLNLKGVPFKRIGRV